MELWSKITGTVRLELTAAEPERVLGATVEADIRVWDVEAVSGLVVRLRVRRSDLSKIIQITERMGGRVEILGLNGLYYGIKGWRKRPVLLGTILLLILGSVWLPNRILFIEVRGNDTVPGRLILEQAARYGLGFGVSRRQVRSEGIKNELLGAISGLEWVGVNTSGSTATITVRERQSEPVEAEGKVCNIAAAADGIIESVTLIRGTVLCQPGQAVREGQILVSGFKDLGICTRAVEAEAEVYARTLHHQKAALPEYTLLRGAEMGKNSKYSLLIGKKRINLYSDSGILPPTCGKMTEVMPLRLPGGLTLPVALVVERYTEYQTHAAPRDETDAERMLTEGSRRYLRSSMVAGTILTERGQVEALEGRYELTGRYECRQMIAMRQDGVYLEGDTEDDPEDSERGAS